MKTTKQSKKITTTGLVIKTVDVGESNRILTLLCKDIGVVSAFAGGVKKPTGKLTAGCSLFVYSQFVLTKTGESYRVDEAVPQELFFNLRYDITSVALASYFCELLARFSLEGTPGDAFLSPVLNGFYLLCKENPNHLLIKSVVELKLMCAAGFMPDFTEISCGHKGGVWFDYTGGNLVCDKCRAQNTRFVGAKLSKTVLDALSYIVESDIKKAFSFDIPLKDLKMLSNICEGYVAEQIEYRCKTLKSLKELLK